MDEVLSGPPLGWCIATLNEVATHHSGNSKLIKGKLDNSPAQGLFPAFSASGQDVWRDGYEEEGSAIIISAVGARCGKCFKASGRWSAIANTHIVWPRPGAIDRDFLWYKLNDENFWVRGGSAQPFVKTRESFKHEFLLPPLAEQRRIVEKIEMLFAQLDKGEETVRQVQALLKRYRQSVLKAAVTGALTADWREENRDKLEHGRHLLARILETRRANWSGRGRYKEPIAPDTSDLPELPAGWAWATLDQLVSGRARSMQSGPFGSTLKHSEFTTEGVLVVGIDNVREGSFSMGSANRISPEKYEELRKYTARPGDLLVTVMASLGRTCVVPDDLETAIITKHVYRISMERDLVSPEFYNMLLQTEWVSRRRMFENAQGQTRPGLNSSILRALPVPLPTPAEQEEVLSRVTAKLEYVDEIEARVETELARSSALRQSILKQAFSGRLVPQDPADEPASALLDRIRAAAPAKKTRKAKA